MDYKALPVYQQKDRILRALKDNQVIVVQSPTGSGKTTQIPVILHEAGYSQTGVIAVTQPRRIAALSVSEFIAKQLGTKYPGLVGYKMRFEDKTSEETKIKIMTDGILLQEMKLDPNLSRYSVLMVDEAHERSLNIDFVLGLAKRVLPLRSDLRVIVSSATMNAKKFSDYFDGCPIITIDTQTYPVTLIYDSIGGEGATTTSPQGEDALLDKITTVLSRIVASDNPGDTLIFLPGERVIKDCMMRIYESSYQDKVHVIPLYGRLSKSEQEKVFLPAPPGKRKVVVSTNIAETSVTISGITSVIDSGLCKLNYYNPDNFTSSLKETGVSQASCQQRTGRAGRTAPGVCYRLYPRADFSKREEYTLEEIYRTDLSEVVLRMAELGITDFKGFDFISPPGPKGMQGAIDTLNMLKALNSDNTLSKIGELMVRFPLLPRISRVIVESMLNAPDVLEEVLIAASFLSAQNPFIMPTGEETEARRAHHNFNDKNGDFVSFITLFQKYSLALNKEYFCHVNYLDDRVMAEIFNIKSQLEDIVRNIGFPVTSGGSVEDYLYCISCGMLQFVCIRGDKRVYRSLTCDHIQIHPASCLFHSTPMYIVAGEIVRTSRMFASTVSPLTKGLIDRLDPSLLQKLDSQASQIEEKDREKRAAIEEQERILKATTVAIGDKLFPITRTKKKRYLTANASKFIPALEECFDRKNLFKRTLGIKVRLIYGKEYVLFHPGEKMELIARAQDVIGLFPCHNIGRPRKFKLNPNIAADLNLLMKALPSVLSIALYGGKELGFIALDTTDDGRYRLKVEPNLMTCVNLSMSRLERLIDETADSLTGEKKSIVNTLYRKLNSFYEEDKT